MLNVIRHEATGPNPQGVPPLLIVHGLFGSGRNWGVIARRLASDRLVLTPDMRNHGQSFWSAQHGYPDLAGDLVALIEAEVETKGSGPVDVVGHSMGGKAAMVLALTRPDLVRRLVVADIAPVTYGHSQLGNIAAMRAVDLSRVEKRSDAVAQLATRVADPTLQAFFTQSLDVTGRRWRLHLDTLEREMPKILSFPELSGQFAAPTLFLTGGRSDYVQAAHRPRIRALFPKARFARLPNAGHWLHAEAPRDFEATVRAFLAMSTGD